MYCGGGYDGTALHNELLRYNPATNTWTNLAPSPDQHFLSEAVFNSGKIYNMGGFVSSGLPTNVTRIYNIATNTWTTGAPMPAALGDQATVLWNGKIYVAGGYNGSTLVNTLYAYNIAANTWSTPSAWPPTDARSSTRRRCHRRLLCPGSAPSTASYTLPAAATPPAN